MSLRIQQLNGDTTFLLTFSPPFAPEVSKRYPGDFVVLVDPWLRGHSSFVHPAIQISHRTRSPALQSLEDLGQRPDLIIISQDKPDHCHRETLCSLPRDTDISVLATPSAAKKIRSWNYFNEDIVHDMGRYDPNDEDSVVRIALPGYSESCIDGEITIANVPTKRDVAGVHNAIGITYQPASTVLTANTRYKRQSGLGSMTLSERSASSALESRHGSSIPSSSGHSTLNNSNGRISNVELPNGSKNSQSIPREEVLSLIYTPHGISTHTLEPYIHNHLEQLDALPLFALFHCVTVEENPWFMGGKVLHGVPGGISIAKRLGARYWISAHDQPKHNHGMATVWLKTVTHDVQEVEEMLDDAGIKDTKFYHLGVGEVLRLPQLEKSLESATGSKIVGRKGLTMQKGQRMNVEDNVLAMPEPRRPMSEISNLGVEGGAVAPGTRVRIRREITDPEGRWI